MPDAGCLRLLNAISRALRVWLLSHDHDCGGIDDPLSRWWNLCNKYPQKENTGHIYTKYAIPVNF